MSFNKIMKNMFNINQEKCKLYHVYIMRIDIYFITKKRFFCNVQIFVIYIYIYDYICKA